jgi:hypothetical protein
MRSLVVDQAREKMQHYTGSHRKENEATLYGREEGDGSTVVAMDASWQQRLGSCRR